MTDTAGLDFRDLVDRFVDVVIVHDGQRLLYANQAAADLVGAPSPAPLVGRPILDFVAPESQPSVVARARALTLSGGVKGGNERVFVRLDGTKVTVETTGIALGGGRSLVVIRDVSRRARAEEARRSAESQLAAFSEVAVDGIAIARASDGRHLMVNAAHARIFGFDRPDDEAGTTFFERVAEAERPQMAELARQLQSGEVRSVEFVTRGVRRDGTEFALEARSAAFKDGDETLIAATMRDVTEHHRLEQELRASEQRYRELFELTPVALWEDDFSAVRRRVQELRDAGVTDLRAHLAAHPEQLEAMAQGVRVVDFNSTAAQLLGAGSKEQLRANLGRVFGREAFETLAELVYQMAEGRQVLSAEGSGGTMDGRTQRVLATARIFPGHEEDWRRVLISILDVTEHRRAEGERALLQERLRHAEKLEAVGRLAGGIAHDFNNILSGILGYAELTQLALDKGNELFDHQQRIREATLRARSLVRQILTFSRRDLANQRLVDIPTVVTEALALVRAGVPATITLEPRIDPEAGAAVIDPTQLHQVVLNLCSNARDAIGERGRIELDVASVRLDVPSPDLPPGRYVRLRVRDDGVGMDASTLARIFEPYMTTKGPFGGHGLGLPVVHGIATAAGGAVRVESAPGRGSTFDVFFPWRPAAGTAAGTETTPATAPEVRGLSGLRILLVDDEALVRNTHRRLLQSLGCSVEVAADGQEALARFREAPDAWGLVLTDQSMPGMGGTELARAILALRPGTKVVLFTGYGDALDATALRREGVRTVVQKPVDRATLAGILETVLSEA